MDIKQKSITKILYSILLIAVTIGLQNCKKENSVVAKTNTADSTIIIADTSITILSKWKLLKDSIVSDDKYTYADGLHPISGIYYGTLEDYYLFNNSNIMSMHENGLTYSNLPYIVLQNTQLVINNDYNYIASIVILNSSELILQWDLTSANGGKYFRRLYLNK